jgi:hypothetical protein
VGVLCKSQMIFEKLAVFIIKQMLSDRWMRSGSIYLRHLGEVSLRSGTEGSRNEAAAQGKRYRFGAAGNP